MPADDKKKKLPDLQSVISANSTEIYFQMLKRILPGVTILLFFWSCQTKDAKKDISSFYFPVENLDEGLVYEYRAAADSLAPFYMYYRTVKNDSQTFLVAMQYDFEFIPQQLAREEIVENGVMLAESFLFENDLTGRQVQIPVEIESGSVFPFEVNDSGGIFLYKIKWYEPADTSVFTRLIRNRKYEGDTSFVFKNKKLPAVKFEVKELAENYDEGFLEHEFSGMEVYAKNIGLVYFKKKVSEDLRLEYALFDTYPMKVLEEKFRKNLERTE